MCVFQQKTGHISEMVRDTAKVMINLIGSIIRPVRRNENHRPWMTLKVTDHHAVRSARPILATAGFFVILLM